MDVLAALSLGVVLLLLSRGGLLAVHPLLREGVPGVEHGLVMNNIGRQTGALQDLVHLLDSFAVLELRRMLLWRAVRPDTRRLAPAVAGAKVATVVALRVAPLLLDHQVVDAAAFAVVAQVTDLKSDRPAERVALGFAGRLRRLPVSEKLTGPLVTLLFVPLAGRTVLVVWNEATQVTSDLEAFALHRAVGVLRRLQRVALQRLWRDDVRPENHLHKVRAGIDKLERDCSLVQVPGPDFR